MKLVQFTPYYPPHIWWVETVTRDIHKNWNYWKSLVFTSDIGQTSKISDENIIFYPAVDLVHNFPLPKFWDKRFWNSLKLLKKEYSDDTKIITHTRFFFSSFLWAFLAKKYKINHIHIEHGSAYVSSWKIIVDILSKIYDKILWKYCIKNADTVLGISNASAKFVQQQFWREDVKTWYRGINFPKTETDVKKSDEIISVYIWRLVALKQVGDFIEAYKNWTFSQKAIIIWEWVLGEVLKKQASGSDIEFLGHKNHSEIIKFLQTNRCILVNPSSQEWLPTTVIEWLMTKNIVIATDVWGTSEISNKKDLQLYKSWNTGELEQYMKNMLGNYDEYSSQSYKWIKSKFSMKSSIENLYNFLK